MAVTLYGIKNCDTIKKARKWLEVQQIDYSFHDFRVDSLDANLLEQWFADVGWETLLNKRGTTWRQLSEEIKSSINEASARQLMLDNPAIIKRPVLDTGSERHVGFSEVSYQTYFKHQTS